VDQNNKFKKDRKKVNKYGAVAEANRLNPSRNERPGPPFYMINQIV